MATEQPLVRGGAQTNAATLVTATTGAVVWSLETALFHGALPGPLYVLVQLGVPWLCGQLAAELTYRRARRRLDCPKAA